MDKLLKEKYKGFVRTIDLNYIDYEYNPDTGTETKNIWVLTWRPWKLESETADKQLWTSTDRRIMFITKEAMIKDGIQICYPAIDNTITVPPEIAKLIGKCVHSGITVPRVYVTPTDPAPVPTPARRHDVLPIVVADPPVEEDIIKEMDALKPDPVVWKKRGRRKPSEKK